MWTIALTVLVALAVLVGLFRLLSSGKAPLAGSVAPEFSLPSQDGDQISLTSFRGKWVVLYFYPKDLTPGCTVEARNFQRDQAEFMRRNAVVLGVSLDSAASHRKFCQKEGLNFKLLADSTGQVARQYGSLVNLGVTQFCARNTFLIDPKGRIGRVYTNVSPARHSAEVLAAIDTLEKSASVPIH